MKPHRIKMAHSLIVHYGLANQMDVRTPALWLQHFAMHEANASMHHHCKNAPLAHFNAASYVSCISVWPMLLWSQCIIQIGAACSQQVH